MNAIPDTKITPPYEFKSFLDSAVYWFHFGFKVIPLQPKGKVTAEKWDGWLDGLSEEKIRGYWTQHPDHEVGFIVGDGYIVFDADTPESKAKLYEIEKAFDISPLLITKTKKGEHHFFKRPKDVYAKTNTHSTTVHPDRLDVKTGRTMVVLPPSKDKEVDICEVDSSSELSEVNQDFVDAIDRHNGRPAPRPLQPREQKTESVVLSTPHELLASILCLTSPDCGYEDWLQTLMAIFHETGGSEEGLTLADNWSSNGQSYKGRSEVESKWRSFKTDVENPVTIKTLTKKLDAQGIDWMGICSESLDAFEVCEDFVSSEAANDSNPVSEIVNYVNPFDKFSLRGHSAEIEKNAVEPDYVMEGIAVKGQYTFLYAAPNTGKTLLSFSLIMNAIREECINPNKLYYLNMDDTAKGLLEKNRIADEYGFNMLSTGYKNFKASDFLINLKELTANDFAKDVIVFIDTAKKFFSLMKKDEASQVNEIIRTFVAKGGTVIALAHVNKNLDQNGKPVHAGTSDTLDDCDCAYTLVTVSKENNVKVVEFENIKRRGNVVNNVSYGYTIEDGSSYEDILLSVEKVGDDEINTIKHAEAIKADAELIDAVKATINEGINTKMKLAEVAGKKVNTGKGKMNILIDKYTGEDPVLHRWMVTVGAHGAKLFSLLEPQS
ncbi:MAG: PriCT-2 domain-containing protein [Methylococcales bacterium]|nr:PriCT-2 domain-containing protein [Methylococcales bacterium]